MAQNSNVPRSQEDYITGISEQNEGRVKKKLSQEFSGTENRFLGALSCLDNFLMNPLIQGYCGTTPETPRNAYGLNQRTNEEKSQSDPHPEAGLFQSQTTQNSGPEDGQDMVTGVHEEVTYCSPSTVSGKQKKKNRSTSQPHFHSENTPATIEADQYFWPFSSWQTTTILQVFSTTLIEFPSLQSHSPKRCPRLTGSLRSLSCLKTA